MATLSWQKLERRCQNFACLPRLVANFISASVIDTISTSMRFVTIAHSQFIAPPRTCDPRQQSAAAAPRFSRRLVSAFLLVTPTGACIAPAAADVRSPQQQQSMPSRQGILDSSSSSEHSPRQDETDLTTAEIPMLIAGSWRKDKDLSDMEVCPRWGEEHASGQLIA